MKNVFYRCLLINLLRAKLGFDRKVVLAVASFGTAVTLWKVGTARSTFKIPSKFVVIFLNEVTLEN